MKKYVIQGEKNTDIYIQGKSNNFFLTVNYK